ncbi:ABC transporter substrate-binding protein [Salinisphaera aquimarina]|uniref:ABC transporter substrate-binding protein n=1 Tax=Salinisphaera aquimarina TaxID=2094031 RepID=A0ABV7EMF7_9GAMM
MLRKKWIAAAALVLAFGASTTQAAEPLRLGVVVPLTGDLQSYGVPGLKGAKLAAQEINAAGGVLGADIEISTGDSQTLPQAGVDAAQKLVNLNRVVGLVGAMSSGVTIPVALSVSKPNGIPQISNASTSPKITSLDDNDFLFRDIPSDAFQGVALAQVVKDAGVDKVGIIYVNNDYGEGLKDAFSTAFKDSGGSVVGTAAYEQKQSSYDAEVSRAYGDGSTQALVLIGYPQNGQTILRQSLEGGKFDRFFFSDGMKATDLITNLGAQYLNGSLGTVPQAEAGSEAANHFANAYKKANGELPPQPYIDTAYDATYLLALAAAKAGTTTDSTKIRDALRDVAGPPGEKVYPGEWAKAADLLKQGKDIDWVGAAGDEDFDEHGDVAGTYGKWTIKDGKIETLEVFTPSK